MADGKFFDRFYFRDHKNANRFKPNATPPRQLFEGYVEFGFNPEVQLGDNLIFREQISSLLQTATLPSMSVNNIIKNQYNIKRVVATGVDYSPVEMTVFDTVNNEWAALIMRYYSYMFMQPRNKLNGTTRDEGIPEGYRSNAETLTRPSEFMADTFESNAAGLNIGNDPNFFNHIKIVVYHAGKGTEYILFKPTLTEFQLGEIDYTSSETRKFQLRFEYENFTINNEVNFVLNEDDKTRFERMSDDAFAWMEQNGTSAENNPNLGTKQVGFTGRKDTKRHRSVQSYPKGQGQGST